MSAISVQALSKTFSGNAKALKEISLTIEEGEMVALIGASGSGKSTLIRHVAGLVSGDRSSGEIRVHGNLIQRSGRIPRKVRQHRRHIGVVFQQFNLIGRLSVLTNVLMGVLGTAPAFRTIFGIFTKSEKRSALQALERVGIESHADKRADKLSGGQQQRAAIARTIVQGARVILADEPIASLDPASSRKVMDNLSRVNRDDNVTVLVSLHQVDYAIQYCPRTIAMRDGQIVFDGASDKLTPAFLQELYGAESVKLTNEEKQRETFAEAEVKPVNTPETPHGLPVGAQAKTVTPETQFVQ
ncbi:phosphonate ABC transporter ATP-binding protein [Aestuariispira insulae]|uniref:Phosphonate transport system ATP-binding protein n=1 Tax=Aestuariispira insulae TaxID=1461337 RepID=A0A3D9H5V8_9PROT|nr:phosphonate ABC transporter ATP-binding protein [Aestuariispira insulae]RED44864.1 phosphonate transport system ATP-binding protein [Aestuariispira insulae]